MLLMGAVLTMKTGTARQAQPCVIDEALIARVAQNDMEALAELYHATSSKVYGFALSITKNMHDAEDVLQETYLKLRAGAHLYKPQGKPLAWLLTIARNLSLMKIRERGKALSLEERDVAEEEDFSAIENSSDRMALQAVLELLGDDERQIVMLHSVAGLKHREIAQMMGLPLATVLSKNSRALKKLRRYLEEGGGSA